MRPARIVGRLLVAAMTIASGAAFGSGPDDPGLRPDVPAELLPLEITAAQWEEIHSGEVFVRLLETPGSAVKKGIAIAIVDAEPERVFQVVTDNDHFAEFMPRVKESSVATTPEGASINYQHISVPIIADRKYKIEIHNRDDEVDGTRRWISSWTHVKGFGNIKESHGSWTLMAAGDGATLVIYEVITDPGGSIPRFLKNMATKRTLPDLLQSIGDRVRDPRYDR